MISKATYSRLVHKTRRLQFPDQPGRFGWLGLLVGVLWVSHLAVAYASPLSLVARFALTEERNNQSHNTRGILYYGGGVLTVYVEDPIVQRLLFRGDTLTIYYPDRREVIKIPTVKGKATLPIFQSLLNAGLDDWGLGQAGYALRTTETFGDSLRAIWTPSVKSDRTLGQVTLVYHRDTLLSVESADGKGAAVAYQLYSDYIILNGRYFPLHSRLDRTGEEVMTRSVISLDSARTVSELPDSVVAFPIPADVKETVVNW